jgi:hypothetical protein
MVASHDRYDCICPSAPCESMASARHYRTCYGPNVVFGSDRAEAAALSAIASGFQHKTIKAIRYRMARSLSASASTSSP